MRYRSIFSDNVRYIQHEQMTPQNLNIDTLDYRHHKELYLKLKQVECLVALCGAYVEVLLGGQSSSYVQTTLLVFLCCEATGG